MSFTINRKDTYVLIQTECEKLDSTKSPALKSEFVVLNSEGFKNFILDLNKTLYCDSSGLSAILVANRLCKNSGGKLVLTGMQEAIKKLITISQLDTILIIANGQDESVAIIKEK